MLRRNISSLSRHFRRTRDHLRSTHTMPRRTRYRPDSTSASRARSRACRRISGRPSGRLTDYLNKQFGRLQYQCYIRPWGHDPRRRRGYDLITNRRRNFFRRRQHAFDRFSRLFDTLTRLVRMDVQILRGITRFTSFVPSHSSHHPSANRRSATHHHRENKH